MIGAQAHDFVVYLAKIIELSGVAIIVCGIIFAAANFVWEGVRS
jgi:hypothetical protein